MDTIFDAVDATIDERDRRNTDKVKFFLQVRAYGTLDSVNASLTNLLANPPLDANSKVINAITATYGLNESRVLGFLANGYPVMVMALINGLAAIRSELVAEILFNEGDYNGSGMDFAMLFLIGGNFASGTILGGASTATVLGTGWNGSYSVP